MAYDITLNHCVVTVSKATIISAGIGVNDDSNCQYSWTAPSWPAWNAVNTLFADTLLLAGVTTPPIPGIPPYTSYTTDPWGNARDTIGAVYMAAPAVPCTVMFTNASSGNPDTHDWDFGDESPHSSDANPTHEYAAEGDYDVTHTASLGTEEGSTMKSVHAFNEVTSM